MLSLNDDDLVINEEMLYEADYIVELEPGETIADFDRIQTLTNAEILDEMDDEEEMFSMHEEAPEVESHSEYDEMASIDSDNVVFVRLLDLTENLDADQLDECAFYATHPGGFAYEIVDRDSD